VTGSTGTALELPHLEIIEAEALRGERKGAAMLTVLTTVLFGIVAVTSALGVSSLFVLR